MDFVYPSQEIRTPPDGFQVQKQLLLGNLRVLLRAKQLLLRNPGVLLGAKTGSAWEPPSTFRGKTYADY